MSVATGGAQAGHNSFTPAISGNDRYVAFNSFAPDLVAGDTNGQTDVFVRDRQTGATGRVSVHSDGTQGNHASFNASISADGRYVAFESFASNLVAGDTNGDFDVFVHDRQAGTTERVSVHSDGAQGNGASEAAAISADGRYVAFQSMASNLVDGDVNGSDVLVHDRQAGTTELVSVAGDGTQAGSGAFAPSISADGRYVGFDSVASNLTANDTNGTRDVFVRDRQAGTTERVSLHSDGSEGNDPSGGSALSADGRYVAFGSFASNLVAGDTNRWSDIFVRDRQAGTTERVSVATGGTQADGNPIGDSFDPSISGDGRRVTFDSYASTLVAGDTNDSQDIFRRDRQAGVTERISVSTNGAQANDHSIQAAISADGSHVAFASDATNLVAGDSNARTDVFVRDPAGTACSDGLDNDGDGAVDHPADPGCASLTDNNETNARCNDGRDNDGDGKVDHPADTGCTSLADNNETNPQCNDGVDNDGDGKVDHPDDSGCSSPTDNRENTAPALTLVTDPGPGEPFGFGDTVSFDVTVTDDAPVDCSNVRVTYVLRHAAHGHAGQTMSGCTGTLTADLDSGHGAQDDLSALFAAAYIDAGGLRATDEVDLPPNP